MKLKRLEILDELLKENHIDVDFSKISALNLKVSINLLEQAYILVMEQEAEMKNNINEEKNDN